VARPGIVSRSRPALVIFVVDQSAAMAELATIGSVTASRAVLAAETVNRAILALILMSTRRDGAVAPCFEVSIIRHGGSAGVTWGLGDSPDGPRTFGLEALAGRLSRAERRRWRDPDGTAIGQEGPLRVPAWLGPAAAGEPNGEAALGEAGRIARGWTRRHPRSEAPLLLTVGGGAIAAAGPALADLGGPGAKDRDVWLVHCLLNDEAGGPIRFPADRTALGHDEDALRLFDLASPVAALGPGVRALLRNSDAAEGLERLFEGRVRAEPRGLLAWLGLARAPSAPPARGVGDIPWTDLSFGDGVAARAPPSPLAPPIGRAEDDRFDIRWCLAPKDGVRPRECEDAIGLALKAGRFCVVDGAGEGAFSRLWARTLAGGWRHVGQMDRDDEALREGVKRLDGVLRERIDRQRRRTRERQGGRLYWFQTQESGSEFAAFLGLAFGEDASWRALAVGDCCVFIERGDTIQSFPLVRPEDFQGGAYLAPSAIDEDASLRDHVLRLEGRRRTGDRFLLMSDAMACWYLTYPQRRARLRELLTTRDRRALGALIARERQARRLRNDDIAIMLIRIKTEL
jgi:hypothetical protein